MLVHSWWMLVFVSEHLRSINVPTFISVRFRTTSYFMLFPFIPIFPKAISNPWVFPFDPWPRTWVRDGSMAALAVVHLFFLRGCSMDLVSWQGQWNCRAALPSWFLTPSSASSDFQHPWHFDARQLLKVKVRVHDKESKDLKRLYRCDGRMFVNSNEFKWFCRKVTVFFSRNSKQGDEGSINQTYALAGIS